jgi:hypothetical protein
MNTKRLLVIGIAGLSCVMPPMTASAGTNDREKEATGLVREVLQATEDFRDVNNALAAGYGSSGSCVSGPEKGAMGVHFPKGSLVEDGLLDPQKPEILIYEQRGGRLRLLGVEFLVTFDAWHANNVQPPVLLGQHFHYVGTPNRYGLPAFYELHVWAWRDNPNGMFVDWNPAVSCEEFTGDDPVHSMHGSSREQR